MSIDDELSDHEKAAFAELPTERLPPAPLEDRVVGALQQRGLLAPRRRVPLAARVATAVVAGLVLFVAGAGTGIRFAPTPAGAGGAAPDPESRAARVQQTGSAYVEAVARLVDTSTDEGGSTDAGLEAAKAALHAATLELARLRPDDPTIRLMLTVLEERAASGRRTTYWF